MSLSLISTVNKLLLAFLVLVTSALAYLLWTTYREPADARDRYHAVYLTSGDLYFGKLRRFPALSLTNAYYLERNPGDPQAPYRLAKFSNALWGPGDRLELNRENVVWINSLTDESPVVRALRAAQLGELSPGPPPSMPTVDPSSTSSP